MVRTNNIQTAKKISFLTLFNDNHNRIQHLLKKLKTTVNGCLQETGCCLTVSAGIHQLSRSLDFYICEHHSDEEVYVYQPLLKNLDKDFFCMYSKTLDEHAQIEDSWALLHSMLHMAAHYPAIQSPDELAQSLDSFLQLKLRHMEYEIKYVFPAAKNLVGKERAQKIAARILWRRQITGWNSALTPPIF